MVVNWGNGRSSCERAFRVNRFHCSIDPVVLLDAGQVPLDDLRNCVLVIRVQALQLRDRDLEQVAIHRRRLCTGASFTLQRRRGLRRRKRDEQQNGEH